jgi:GNAT superfamily N-acetyltransferase
MSLRYADWELIVEHEAESPNSDLVRRWLREHNWSTNADFLRRREQSEHQVLPLILLAAIDGCTVGGLLAETQFSWLRISIMAVCPEKRSLGIGASLLDEAERQAVTRGCKYAYVDTMDYQAPQFYRAHGYRIAGQIDDWDSHGHAKFFLTKLLVPESA